MAFFLCGMFLIARAHRLDEYLQATFISVEPDHIDVEISLTPGIGIASGILAQIDQNQDGRISASEGTAYARQVLDAVNLDVDQSPRTLSLIGNKFASTEELKAGVGLIRINLRAELPELVEGHHQLSFQNHHATNVSVYLVNALIPASRRIEITRQSRDTVQSATRIDFTVSDAGDPIRDLSVKSAGSTTPAPP